MDKEIRDLLKRSRDLVVRSRKVVEESAKTSRRLWEVVSANDKAFLYLQKRGPTVSRDKPNRFRRV